jgi:hypothetical protein
MSTGTPPNGESASSSVAPRSTPIEESDLDSGWQDAQEPVGSPIEALPPKVSSDDALVLAETSAEPVPHDSAKAEPSEGRTPEMLPQSLSPVVLSSTDVAPSEPPLDQSVAAKVAETAEKAGEEDGPKATVSRPVEPAADGEPATVAAVGSDQLARSSRTPDEAVETRQPESEAAESKSTPIETASKKVGSGATSVAKRGKSTALVLGAAAVLMGGLALFVLRPKHAPTPVRMGTEPAPQLVQPAAVNNVNPEVPVASAESAPSANQAAIASAAPPLATAAASAAPSASSSLTNGESFTDAFIKHAAKKDAKWADMKVKAGASKSTGAAPGAAKPPQPGNSDPLDVLKRLEDSRKAKRQ